MARYLLDTNHPSACLDGTARPHCEERRAGDHLRELTARERSTILDSVENQLTHQADHATRHRKPLQPNSLAPWELRAGDFRVFYDVETQTDNIAEPEVVILAIGVKKGSQVWIGGEEQDL
jgi:mRNA-degrading endonuclease RelE of RelBE toxin-antitoxin system